MGRCNVARARAVTRGEIWMATIVAATGVDRISIGRLTKDVKAVDYSMRVVERV